MLKQKDTTRIARQFHWEMGHRLPFHTAGCASIHGHSYTMWVELEGVCDEHGMLLDYAEMKKIVQPLIDPLDHSFMCEEDDAVMRPFLEQNGFKVYYVPFVTTAENIARFILSLLWEKFESIHRISAVRVRLYETANAFAEVEKNRD